MFTQKQHELPKPKPTFLLLPSSVALNQARLGRVVTDVHHPGSSFRPRFPLHGPNTHPYTGTPLIQRKARGVFLNERYASIRAQLTDLLHIDFARDAAEDVYWQTGTLTTRTLVNHPDYLQQLAKTSEEVRDYIDAAWNPEDKRHRQDVYLIVGLKEWTDAEVSLVSARSTKFGGKGTVPVGSAAQIPTDKLDVAVEGEGGTKREVSSSGQYEGSAVFAVEFRRIRKSPLNRLSLEKATQLGQSTFSGPHQSAEQSNRPAPKPAAEEVEFELDDHLDEESLERGEFVCSRIQLEDFDLLVVSQEDPRDEEDESERGDTAHRSEEEPTKQPQPEGV